MKQIDPEILQAAAHKASGLLKALSNPDRLVLMCQMTQGEFCVSELEEATGVLQPTLSQQLAVLRDENLVSTRREGKQIYYTIASDEAAAVMQTLYEQFCLRKVKKK